MTEAVVKSIDVACNPGTAFSIFVEKIENWWPLDKNTISAMNGKTAKSLVIEPREGGRIIETAHDDEQLEWGTVTRYEPGKQLTLAWKLASSHDIAATRVNINFTAIDDNTTRVELTHDGFEAHGDNAQNHRDNYNNGWVGVFEEAFLQACV